MEGGLTERSTAHVVRFSDECYVAVIRTICGFYHEGPTRGTQFEAEHDLRYLAIHLSLRVDYAGVVDRQRDHHGQHTHGRTGQ